MANIIDAISGLEWILKDDRFGFGKGLTKPETDEEQAGCYINDAIKLLKEQRETINNYKEIVENLLQQIQDISKYMTPIGRVSDVRAYLEGRPQPEIIRCYACKYGEQANDVYLCGKSRGFGIAHEPDWFCADGERK